MPDGPDRIPQELASTGRVVRLVSDQLGVVENQIGQMRSADTAAAVGASGEPQALGLPLTGVQRDVWINCQLSPGGSAAYNISTTISLKGDLKVEALRESVRQLVQRHESLRTTFDPNGDRRILHETVHVELQVIDVSGLPEAERMNRVADFIDSDLSTPYDLVEGPLFRATLIQLNDADHTLVLSAHHLVCDGWSFGVLERDLGAFYSALVLGERDSLPAPTQYREYAAWRADEVEFAEPYWLGLYEEPPVELDLPTDRARPPFRTYEYACDRAVIDEELLAALKELAASQGVTLFVVLHAAWEIMLHRLSGQREFASGVFVAGQTSIGVRDLVGLCANLLPLRVRVMPDEPLSDHLKRLRRSMFEALDSQDYAVGQLASALNLPRDVSRPTVVSTAMTFETPTMGVDFEGLRTEQVEHGRRTFGAYDFEAYLSEAEHDLKIDFQYSTDLFESDTIGRWLGYYIHLLRQMTAEVTAPVADLRLLDDAERREILTSWNDTRSPIPNQSTPERIELQAARHPDRVAIRTSGGSLTYGELNARANRLVSRLADV